MNEEIKFRGKDIEFGTWAYGYLTISKLHGFHKIHFQDNDYLWHETDVLPETVGQFTGLRDKNGKEIYRGDIVRLYFDDGKEFIFEITFDKKQMCWLANHKEPIHTTSLYNLKILSGSAHSNIEVIGNIHDNADLLNN